MNPRELVNEACELLLPPAEAGVRYRDLNLFKVYLDILCARFRFNAEIPAENRQGMMKKCILSISSSSSQNDDQLAKLLRQEEKAYLQTPKTSFTLLSSVSLKYDAQIARISTSSASFTLIPSRPRSFHLPDGGSVRLRDATPSGYSYIKVHVQARDQWSAAEVAMNSLDLMRSFWNLYFNRKTGIRETWVSDGMWTPVNKLIPGPIHTLHKRTGALALEGAWWTSYIPKAVKPLNVCADYAELKRFERYVRRQIRRCNFGLVVERFLVRYVRALDSYDSTTTLLNLWSTLEELAGVKSLADSNRLVKRVAFLDHNPRRGGLLLDFIRDHRNMIAHAGATPGEVERLIYILKMYVEGLLWFVIRNAPKYNSHEQLLRVLDLPVDRREIHLEMERLRQGLRFRRQSAT